MDALVSTQWLADNLGARDLRVLDATMVAGDLGRDPAAEFAAGHIAGAQFLNLAALRDIDSALPNMLPPPERAVSRLRALGGGDGDRIVLYDDSPWRTAARAWFVLRTLGLVGRIALLDGGLAKWRAEGRPLVAETAMPRPRHLTPDPDLSAVRDLAAMRANLAESDGGGDGGGGAAQVIDARSAARFTGAEADPHPGTAAGHMPGSINLPYTALFAPDGTWLRGDALRETFARAGTNFGAKIVTTCGSGVTAAVLLFGLHLLGQEGALYDGSWSEWGADPDTPKATGTA